MKKFIAGAAISGGLLLATAASASADGHSQRYNENACEGRGKAHSMLIANQPDHLARNSHHVFMSNVLAGC